MMLLASLVLAVQEAPRVDALVAVPEDALVVVTLADPDELRSRAAESAWAGLLADARVQPFVTEVARMIEEADEFAESGPALDPRAWWAALHGPVRGWVGVESEHAFTVGVLVALDDDRAALDELVDGLWAAAEADSAASSTTYREIAIDLQEQLEPDSEEEEAGVLARFECAGQLGFVGGPGRERVLLAVHGAIDRLGGHDPSEGFAGAGRLAEARAAVGHRAAFELFVDPGRATELLILHESETTDVDPEDARSNAERIGVLSSRWACLAADAGAGEELDLTFALHLPGGWLQELAGLVGPLPSELLALVPPDSANVTLGRVDVNGMWQSFLDMFEDLAPEEHAQMRAMIEQTEPMLGFDLETDLLERIRGDFLSFDVPIPPEDVPAEVVEALGGGAPIDRGTVQRFGLVDAPDVADVVESLLETSGLGAEVESAEYQGRWIHSVPMALHWCFTDEELLVSQFPTPLRTALARLGTPDAPSITGDARFRAVLERHPRAAVLSIGDTRTNLEAALSVLPYLPTEGEDAVFPLALMELLPPPEVVRDHFEGVTSSAIEVGPAHVAFRMSSR